LNTAGVRWRSGDNFDEHMKNQRFGLLRLGFLASLVALSCLNTEAGAGKDPLITRVRPSGTNLLVTVRLPDGCRRISLESRPRLGSGAWVPRKDHWPAEGVEEVTLTVPIQADVELLRARGETTAELPLPASFFSGKREFAAVVSTNSSGPGGGAALTPGAGGPGVPTTDDRSAEAGSGRAVVESDIWQLDGATLYFFNSARGFQVIDLADVDQPLLRGTLSFAAQGEQMYLLPGGTSADRWVALLTSSACDSLSGEILLVRVRNGIPEMGPRLPFAGQIRESRMVGSALYLATYRWSVQPVSPTDPAQGSVWRAETGVVSFDLSDATHPTARGEKVIAANPDAIQATDRFLFVATSGPATGVDDPQQPVWLRPGVHGVTVFDISDPTGVVEQLGSAMVQGRVADKFKMNLRDDILTVVSSKDTEWRMVTRTNWYTRIYGPNGELLVPPVREMQVYNAYEQASPMSTWLQTFSLTNPATPVRLGQLKIIENESLFATRFVADRVYVVTFRRIDPLWIIDLSNPVAPAIRGELQIPGYSSYLEPVGTNRLLAVGVEQGNATVALFDVTDEARPTQLSKVFLGTGWSWSEANSDEKAFKYLPELGLVLVPWQGYEDGQYVQAMQLVDYAGNRLVKRGIIPHRLQARRATTLADRILSLSGQELLVVDAANRDRPVVKADLDLSLVVSRVRVDGDRLVLLSATGSSIPTVRRVAAAAPEVVLGSLVLPDFPVVGFEMDAGRLHLLQQEPDSYRSEPVLTTNVVIVWKGDGTVPVTNSTIVTNWNQITLPGSLVAREIGFQGDQPRLLGESRIQRPDLYYGTFFRGLKAAPGLMLWVEPAQSNAGYFRGIDGGMTPGGDALWAGGRGWWWWWWKNSLAVVAEDISNVGTPVLRSRVTLGGTDLFRGFSEAYATEGRLYVSHAEAITREEPKAGGATGGIVGPGFPFMWWITETRNILDVVDFADPAEPIFRKPVALPAELAGISHRGALVYTSGTTTNTPAGRTELGALAYDGLGASLVDTTTVSGHTPVRVLPDGQVFAAEPAGTNSRPARIDSLKIGNDARWSKGTSVDVLGDSPVLRSVGSIILSDAQQGLGFIRPTATGPALIGLAPPLCGYWVDWTAGDASPDATVWVPGYGTRLVRVSPIAGMTGP